MFDQRYRCSPLIIPQTHKEISESFRSFVRHDKTRQLSRCCFLHLFILRSIFSKIEDSLVRHYCDKSIIPWVFLGTIFSSNYEVLQWNESKKIFPLMISHERYNFWNIQKKISPFFFANLMQSKNPQKRLNFRGFFDGRRFIAWYWNNLRRSEIFSSECKELGQSLVMSLSSYSPVIICY